MIKYLLKDRLKLTLLILLKAVCSAGVVGFALVLQFLVNLVSAPDATVNGLLIGSGFAMAYVTVFIALIFLKDGLSARFVNKAAMRLRDDLTGKLLNCTYQDFIKEDSSKYLSNLINDVKTLQQNYFASLLILPEEIVTFTCAVAVAFIINYIVALTMLGLTLLIFLVPLIFNKPLNSANLAASSKIGEYTRSLKETFTGIDVVKNFHAADRMGEKLRQALSELTAKNVRVDRLNAFAQDFGMFIIILLQFVSIVVSGYLLITGEILIGSVVAVVQLGNSMYSPLVNVAGKIALIKGVSKLSAEVGKIISLKEETGGSLSGDVGEITVTGLTFGYQQGSNILKGVNAALKPGKKYLVVGKSGSGKSTFLKILCKMYSDYGGSVTVGKGELRETGEAQFYQTAAAAHQRSCIFRGSVRDNIDFGGTGDEQRLNQALALSELTDFVNSLPAGADEIIDEEINTVSGGEKQRIGLARALYRCPKLLLLDEVTSSLDTETARKVEENVLGLKDVTVVSVSHKLFPELVRRYDKVLVLEDGKTVAFATPDEILSNGNLKIYLGSEPA